GRGLGRFNVAPTQEVLTVRSSPDPEEAADGEREARLMRWGLVPRWAKDLKVGYRMINAKAENLTSSRAYGPLVGKFRHRCLIVADGFYEWMKAEDPKQPRQPWRFTVDGGEPFAFAGLCTRKEWDDEEERGVEDGWLYSCTIVTTTPNEVVAKVHDRMPVILPSAEAEAAWLRPDLDVEDAIAMCTPLAAERVEGTPANPRLNKVGKGGEGPRGAGGAGRRGRGGGGGRPADPSAGFRRRRAGFGVGRADDADARRGRRPPDRGEAEFERLFERAARQSPLPFLKRLLVFGPADDDAGLVDVAAQRVVEFERRGIAPVRVEFDDDFFREVLLQQVFAAARARVGGAAAGGLGGDRPPRDVGAAFHPGLADGAGGVDLEHRRDPEQLVAGDVFFGGADLGVGDPHRAAAGDFRVARVDD